MLANDNLSTHMRHTHTLLYSYLVLVSRTSASYSCLVLVPRTRASYSCLVLVPHTRTSYSYLGFLSTALSERVRMCFTASKQSVLTDGAKELLAAENS